MGEDLIKQSIETGYEFVMLCVSCRLVHESIVVDPETKRIESGDAS